MYVFLGIMLGLLVPYGIRVAIGPSVWDRLLAMNLISTKIIVIIVFFSAVEGIDFLLDFAIIYALSGFIGTIFIAMFLAERDLTKKEVGIDAGSD